MDNQELSKINNIFKEEVIHNEVVMNKNDWKDISDIIDDCGFFFKQDNSTDCYEKIKFFFENYYKKDNLLNLKNKNRKRVIENYSMTSCLSKFKEVWN